MPADRQALKRYRIMREVAREYCILALRKVSEQTGTKLHMPRGENTLQIAGVDYTYHEMITAALERRADWCREEAQRRMDQEAYWSTPKGKRELEGMLR